MIALKEARQRVADSIGEEKTPAQATLRGWVHKGVISKKLEGKTSESKYSDHIVAEIIAAIELKKKEFTLKEISDFRKKATLNKDNFSLNQIEKFISDKLKIHKQLNKKLVNKESKIIGEINNELLNKIGVNSKQYQIAKKYKQAIDDSFAL